VPRIDIDSIDNNHQPENRRQCVGGNVLPFFSLKEIDQNLSSSHWHISAITIKSSSRSHSAACAYSRDMYRHSLNPSI